MTIQIPPKNILLCLLVGLLACAVSMSGATNSLESVQKTAAEWVNLRKETSRLRTEWETEKALLQSTLQALKERASQLESQSELVKAKTGQEREELATLRARKDEAAADLAAAEAEFATLARILTKLRPDLPPRLSYALEMAYRTLQDDSQPAGERMQAAMAVLNRCAQFNRQVSGGEEVLAIEDTGEKAYETIYWGLSHGYALDRIAKKAWLGSPSQTGWSWQANDEAAPSVTRLLAIYHGRADPEHVRVPARSSERVAKSSN